jgi:DNA repair exonuclease SbcCD nuclease subunit
MTKKLNKAAMFTDIHFGRKSNSEIHNQDCLDFLSWFCDNVKKDPEIDHVIFLGDWHEQRSAINGITLKYSYKGAKMLNDLNIPIFFIVGNHDMHFRNHRDVYSTEIFSSLNNFRVISEPTVIDTTIGDALISPYLIEEEYPELVKFLNLKVWFGHFEFAGFVLTGETKIMEHGPDPTKYGKPTRIFSGHFHRRQSKGNIFYIGNAFPMDFSDANDEDRGMAIYEYSKNKLDYHNWVECPKYVRVKLSKVLESPKTAIKKNARVKIDVDEDLSFEDTLNLKKKLSEKFNLRELSLEEKDVEQPEFTEVEKEVNELNVGSLTEHVVELLRRLNSDKIDGNKLAEIYKGL